MMALEKRRMLAVGLGVTDEAMEDEEVGKPKAQKLWRVGTTRMTSRLVREDVNARTQMEAREVVEKIAGLIMSLQRLNRV
jgi:hypothetical protein